MAYASRTGTRRTIAALKEVGWGWMVGPSDCGGSLHEMRYALDNGAWPAFANGHTWDESAFVRALGKYGSEADFIVVPDVVGDRRASLDLTRNWLPSLRRNMPGRLLIAVQDGMTIADIESLLEENVGIFIGGSTEWKEQAIIPWGRWARELGIYCHVGRVNTARRIALCIAGQAHSFDGTSATRFAKTIPMIDSARKQLSLL